MTEDKRLIGFLNRAFDFALDNGFQDDLKTEQDFFLLDEAKEFFLAQEEDLYGDEDFLEEDDGEEFSDDDLE